MANLSKIKRDNMLAFLEELKKTHSDDASIRAFNEIEKIVHVGDPITPDVDRFSVESLSGCETVFPVRDDGTEMMWSWLPEVCRNNLKKGYIKAGTSFSSKTEMSGSLKPRAA